MNKSPPLARGARPAWGCLDAEEMRAAAAEQAGDPGIDQHLASCADCRRAVRELRRELGYAASHHQGRRASPVRRRRRFWLVLVALALVAAGALVVRRLSDRADEADQATPVASAPVAAPAAPAPVRRPRVRRGGGPSTEAIVATIRNNQAGVKICYERALKRNDGLTLRLEVNVRIRSTGVVEQVSIDGSSTAALDDCIRKVVKTWQFPRAGDAYRTSFPLRLQPSL